jgi:hypothetical protein
MEENKRRKAPDKETLIERFVIVGLIIALVMSVSGISLAGTSPPQTLNTCTKVNKHGVYGATKVVKGTSCPGKPGRQYFQQWVLKTPPPPARITTAAGVAGGANGDVWIVVVPASSSAQVPTGSVTFVSACGSFSGALHDSGTTVGTTISPQVPVFSPSGDFQGIDTGLSSGLGLFISSCGPNGSYSGDGVYSGF